ncbi:hypothetical protein GCM10012288_13560 [Malaciobacter pacificus]|jgi:mitochondrial fission protein ELM1|uniref:Mitochondrial fission domain-containing protein n=1 Tax=Malaciobacter pacificus TaxID=1080223 RepID=A0A5C2HC98_9BACT|nr:ELM1/GtrOC1 family putative glycosyltransferase [Malaciobacter pacificus]QEP34836.1 mitochondrial fission domain-containing protein [Malaciobacter pacificus]GGD40757.1 hypothetical protein GCM10012288_13560 [Malaciobacter pacificus]
MKRILIISDGKPGHLNQSIAFCKIKKISYDILEVKFKSKFHKAISYIFDKIGLYTDSLYKDYKKYYYEFYDAVISTGSSTYYLNKVISKNNNLKSITLMYPKGYKTKDFDYIIAQEHDSFKEDFNIVKIPLNLSYIKSKKILNQKENEKSLAIVIGGNNSIFSINSEDIREKLDSIFEEYPDYLKYITTSPRTSFEIEALIDEYDFDYKLIYSREPNVNPIGDFIENCEKFFITMDSTSMISEIRANSDANIEIIKLDSKKENTKYHRLINIVENIDNKLDYEKLLKRVEI